MTMSSRNWFEDLYQRAPREPHLDRLGNPYKSHAIRIVTAFEDTAGKDTGFLPSDGRGRIRYAVLNESHRDCRVIFESSVTDGAILFDGNSKKSCEVVAERLARKEAQFPVAEILSVSRVEGVVANQERFSTLPRISVSTADGKGGDGKQLVKMSNIVYLTSAGDPDESSASGYAQRLLLPQSSLTQNFFAQTDIQTQLGDLNMSQDNIHVSNVVGPVNIKSRLDHVSQVVTTSAAIPSGPGAELAELLSELQRALAPSSRSNPQETERIVDAVEMIAKELTKETRSKEFLTPLLSAFTATATALHSAAPAVVEVVDRIVSFVKGFVV